MNLKTILGKNIKQYRILKGFSQEEFAEQLDISQQTLSRIECGKNFLTAETLEKILNILSVKVNELFVYEEEYSPDYILEDIEKYLQLLKTNPKKLACIHKFVKEITFL